MPSRNFALGRCCAFESDLMDGPERGEAPIPTRLDEISAGFDVSCLQSV